MNPQLISGIDATKKLPGEDFKRSWPPLIKMDPMVRQKINERFARRGKLER
jgi:4-hydroxy-3-polyprenylbenzoate decarboxylase